MNISKHFSKNRCIIKDIKLLVQHYHTYFFPRLYITHLSISSHDRPRRIVARILNDVSTPFINAKCHFNSLLTPRHAIFKLLYFYR